MAKKAKKDKEKVENVSEATGVVEEGKVEATGTEGTVEEGKVEATGTDNKVEENKPADENAKQEDSKDNVITNTIVCPHCQGQIIIETPAPQRRGQLAGIELANMTDEQLKREKINAGSVLYKAKARKADIATINKNQARFDAVVAEMEKRKAAATPAATVTPATQTEAPAEVTAAPTTEGASNPEVAAQI
jgi:hypothetical protein